MNSKVGYLGPEGTFTHAAALQLAPDATLLPLPNLGAVYAFVESGEGMGVVPIENSVEGYVVPSLDLLLGAADVIAIGEAAENISFDAFRLADDTSAVSAVLSHPHALAQCKKYVNGLAVAAIETGSTAAACQNIHTGQVAIAAPMSGEIYSLTRIASGVEDFAGAKTRFLLLTNRAQQPKVDEDARVQTFLAVTPSSSGPGVLAGVLEHFAAQGINLSSLITRPLHAQSSRYSFVITADAHSSAPPMVRALEGILGDGHFVKLLGVFAPSNYDQAVSEQVQDGIPAGSVSIADSASVARHLGWSTHA